MSIQRSEERWCSSHIGRSEEGKGSTKPSSIPPLSPGEILENVETRSRQSDIVTNLPEWSSNKGPSTQCHLSQQDDTEFGSESKELKKKIFIYFLFGWARSLLMHRLFPSCGEQGLLYSCGVWSSHCGGLSFYSARAPGHTSLTSCSMWTQQLWFPGSRAQAQLLWGIGSVIVVHGLSCSMARGIFLDQGSNPYLLQWQVDALLLSHQRIERCKVMLQSTLYAMGGGWDCFIGISRASVRRGRILMGAALLMLQIKVPRQCLCTRPPPEL